MSVRADGGARIEFEQPQRAATPGQFAVIYERGRCLGGGAIETFETASDSRAAAVRA